MENRQKITGGVLFLFFLCATATIYAQKPFIFTYVGGYNGNLIPVHTIQATKLTHIIYAFADVYKNKGHLNFPVSDDRNLNALGELRKINPSIKILISVGGFGWSKNFSDMALAAAGRKLFAESCVQLVKKYKLDGIDIDWEFPGYAGGGGNTFRPEDRSNYTLLFKALRTELDALTTETGKRYLLTTAVDGWGSHFLPHTQMDEVQKYVDFILVMAYNFNTPNLVGGHFLHAPKNWPADGSVEGAARAFIAAGVPAAKLVMGAGFFPTAFIMNTEDFSDRQYLSRVNFRGGLGKLSQLTKEKGFTKYWDEEGVSPFLFSPSSRMHISYEDERSVEAKAKFIKENKLAGFMYWDYFSDPGRKLLNSVCKVFSTP
jgi:chitinase